MDDWYSDVMVYALKPEQQEPCKYCGGTKGHWEGCKAPIEPAQQEPVAYGMWDTMLGKGNRMMMVRLDKGQDGCTVPLQPQRTWVGLTDEEIDQCLCVSDGSMGRLLSAIEAKLRSKNEDRN